MQTKTMGLHHITGITGDPQKNLDFYEGFLGQKLIKKTVNFDDPNAYHLYYADAVGTPGTVLTFFYWAGIPKGQRGSGEVASIYYVMKSTSLEYWRTRARQFDILFTEETLPFGETVLMFEDPDGLRVGLVASEVVSEVQPWIQGPVPEEHVLRGFYGALIILPENVSMTETLEAGLGYHTVATVEEVTRFEATNWPGKYLATKAVTGMPRAVQGAGSIHHIAFQARDDEILNAFRSQVAGTGLGLTPLIDRFYFHASYFMTPAGVLFELSTNDIGFTIDEPEEQMGEYLQLPSQYEPFRNQIEATIIPLTLPRHRL
jgi:glyoxalase family protein